MTGDLEDLRRELAWFELVLTARLEAYFGGKDEEPAPRRPPRLGDSAYGRFVTRNELSASERLVLMLALIPHLRPQLLDVLWTRNEDIQRGFTEFGGRGAKGHGGFLPTGETAVFLLGGDDLDRRVEVMRLLDGEHRFARRGVLALSPAHPGEPVLSGALTMGRRWVFRFTTGLDERPAFSAAFPARRIWTERTWEDLVLTHRTLAQLEEVRDWIRYGPTLLGAWGMAKKLPPGFTALFYGPPGTGKTFSACLLGKLCDCEVYRVDLSMIVSKYIGETEKNLSRVFDAAERRGWILFFDEADSLFGQRTQVDDSRDRYANQEVSFLLQRIEEFDGVVILASNMKSNIDDAFMRRFHSVVRFPLPRADERERIWRGALPSRVELGPRVNLPVIAARHELSGGTIMNVVRYTSLKALSRGDHTLRVEDLETGIRRELHKQGRSV